MNKEVISIGRLSGSQPDDYVPGTPAERVAMVWPLTREVASLCKDYDVDQKLQRHITVLKRREKSSTHNEH